MSEPTHKIVPRNPSRKMLRALLVWRGYDPDADTAILDTLGQLDVATISTYVEAYKILVDAA